MSPLTLTKPADDPLMVAWSECKESADYTNAHKWAAEGKEYVDGSLWAMFVAGFRAATERAGFLHEDVDPASDQERLAGAPGAGAMGAVLEYRDKIRQTVVAARAVERDRLEKWNHIWAILLR